MCFPNFAYQGRARDFWKPSFSIRCSMVVSDRIFPWQGQRFGLSSTCQFDLANFHVSYLYRQNLPQVFDCGLANDAFPEASWSVEYEIYILIKEQQAKVQLPNCHRPNLEHPLSVWWDSTFRRLSGLGLCSTEPRWFQQSWFSFCVYGRNIHVVPVLRDPMASSLAPCFRKSADPSPLSSSR